MSHDKQLSGIILRELQQKQRLDQALNAKEFAILAGVSYATARDWLHSPGFPTLSGLVFWQDFVMWRRLQIGLEAVSEVLPTSPSVTNPAAHSQNGKRKGVSPAQAQIGGLTEFRSETKLCASPSS